MGSYDVGLAHFARMRERLEPWAASDALAQAWLAMPASHRGVVSAEPWSALQSGKRAREAFLRAGHSNGRLLAELMIGVNAHLLGAYDEALASFALTSGVNLSSTSAIGAYYEIASLLDLSDLTGAEDKARQLSLARRLGTRLHTHLAEDPDEAEDAGEAEGFPDADDAEGACTGWPPEPPEPPEPLQAAAARLAVVASAASPTRVRVLMRFKYDHSPPSGTSHSVLHPISTAYPLVLHTGRRW